MGLQQFLTILRARKALIFIVLVVTVAAAALVIAMMPKRYEASASVVVDSRMMNPVTGASLVQPINENIVSTQVDIVASPSVALRAVDILGLEKNPRARELLSGPGLLGELREWVTALLPREQADAGGSLKDWMADRLLRNLQVKSNRDSRLVRVTYSSHDPEFSASVANAFVRAYLDTVLKLQVEPAKQNTRWLDEQLQELKRKLEAAETRLSKFQQAKGIVATDERIDLENARLADISAQLGAAQSQSYESQARQRQFRDFLARQGNADNAPAEVMTSPVVQQLRQEVAQREAKLSELSRRVGANHPQHKAAVTELERLRTELNTEMRAAAQGLLSSSGVAGQREGALRGALEQQRKRVLAMKGDRGELAMLVREVENAQQAYNAASQRLTQTRMESEVGQSNGAQFDSAVVPIAPAGPTPGKILFLSAVAGLIFGIGMALLSETFRRYVRSEQDLVEVMNLPVLAVLAPKGGRRQNVSYLKNSDVFLIQKS